MYMFDQKENIRAYDGNNVKQRVNVFLSVNKFQRSNTLQLYICGTWLFNLSLVLMPEE